MVAVWKGERPALSPQFGTDFSKALLDLRKGSPFRLASEDGVGASVGAEREPAAAQVPRLLPGHGLDIIIHLTACLDSPEGAGAVQTFHQVVQRQFFQDRKSTRLNSSHSQISYAVF